MDKNKFELKLSIGDKVVKLNEDVNIFNILCYLGMVKTLEAEMLEGGVSKNQVNNIEKKFQDELQYMFDEFILKIKILFKSWKEELKKKENEEIDKVVKSL